MTFPVASNFTDFTPVFPGIPGMAPRIYTASTPSNLATVITTDFAFNEINNGWLSPGDLINIRYLQGLEGQTTQQFIMGNDGETLAIFGDGSGTVTSVAAGSGLSASPSPIVGAGTISLAAIATGNALANTSGSSGVPTATPFPQITGFLTSENVAATTYTVLPADVGKLKMFTANPAVTVTLNPTGLPTVCLFALQASINTTVTLVAGGAGTILISAELFPGDIKWVILQNNTFWVLPTYIANSPMSLSPLANKIIGWNGSGLIANITPYLPVDNNGGGSVNANTVNFANGTNTTAVVTNLAGVSTVQFNATAPSPTGETILATVNNVDVNQTAKVPLYTVPANFIAVITRNVIRNASISLTTAVTGFGFDANSVTTMPASPLSGFTTNTTYNIFNPVPYAPIGNAGDVFGTKPTVPQGSAATVSIDVIGYLIPV